jgi:hypothetical protein
VDGSASEGPGESARPRPRIARLWPYALIAFLYLATSPYHAGLNNPNEMVRVYMSRALAEEGTFAIDAVLRDWGPVDDKAIRDGKLYSSKAPLQSLLGAAIYPAAAPLTRALGLPVTKRSQTTVLRIFGSALLGIAFSSLLLAWSRRRAAELGAPERSGTALGLVLALGTMLYPYALTFTGHLLAALAAGGTILGTIALARRPVGSAGWRGVALLLGAAGASAPFAEYPAALVAGPMLLAALYLTPGLRARVEAALLMLVGGALPFAIGLWAHAKMWGSPLKTGYSFLENQSYVKVHGSGFFGVGAPKAEALLGALFSPGTGLFFFSPVLVVGLVALVARLFGAPKIATSRRAPALPRALAVASIVGLVLELLFIAGHNGWRGGWTLGPRYIIPVAPLLGLWAIEALGRPRLASLALALGAVSIAFTGCAAALYPHLSDVFTNPLATFLWPSYLRGEGTYGLGHALGLAGHAANAVHLLPLAGALVYVLAAALGPPGGRRAPGLAERVAMALGVAGAALALLALIPEADARAAKKENRRLWGFWEPTSPQTERERAARVPRPGMLDSARRDWRRVRVSSRGPDGDLRECAPDGAARCRYGDQPWQHFGPEALELDGRQEPLLFLHPIAGRAVRAELPGHAGARSAVLRYGLADASVASDNVHPVKVTVRQGTATLLETTAGEDFGLEHRAFTLTSTAPVALELEVESDGARVFGFDLELYPD